MAVLAGYDLTLYCDTGGDEYGGTCPYSEKHITSPGFELNGPSTRACFGLARKAGWTFSADETKCYCPKCSRQQKEDRTRAEQGGVGVSTFRIINADVLDGLSQVADESVHCVVTSPPYYGLRDYGVAGQIGMEPTPDAYVARMVAVFREVRRVLRKDGTCWLNLGDTFAANRGGTPMPAETLAGGTSGRGDKVAKRGRESEYLPHRDPASHGLKHKDLIGIPWRVAFALQADGWYLRSDIIWSKPNPMPESVKDRPTKAHEYVFLLTKSAKYYYDADAVKLPPSPALIKQVADGYNGSATKDFAGNGVQNGSAVKARIIERARAKVDKQRGHGRRHAGFNDRWDSMTREEQMGLGANRRSVWTIPTRPFPGAHFATMPPDLAELCIKAGCPEGGAVLDPFGGAGTTAMVALRLGRDAISIEINPDYCDMQRRRILDDAPLLNTEART